MPKPIVINVAMLVKSKNGSYALDLLRDEEASGTVYRFELTEQAFQQLKEDSRNPPTNVSS